MNPLLGSVTDLTEYYQGQNVLVGSHGGLAVGQHALHMGVSGLICHDAGIGREEAGVTSLALLDSYEIPAASVGHQTARIGDPQDMLNRGCITRVNEVARFYGLKPSMSCSEAFSLLTKCRSDLLDDHIQSEQLSELKFGRYEINSGRALFSASHPVVVLDSASSIKSLDRESVIVTGSHGGLPGNLTERAIKHKPCLVFFNDAGGGIDSAGISRLSPLDQQNVPAACVDCWSALIGDGRSTYETGIISFVNERAKALSIAPGMPVKDAIKTFQIKSKLQFQA